MYPPGHGAMMQKHSIGWLRMAAPPVDAVDIAIPAHNIIWMVQGVVLAILDNTHKRFISEKIFPKYVIRLTIHR